MIILNVTLSFPQYSNTKALNGKYAGTTFHLSATRPGWLWVHYSNDFFRGATFKLDSGSINRKRRWLFQCGVSSGNNEREASPMGTWCDAGPGDSPKLSCFEKLSVLACRRSLVKGLEGGFHDGDKSTHTSLSSFVLTTFAFDFFVWSHSP